MAIPKKLLQKLKQQRGKLNKFYKNQPSKKAGEVDSGSGKKEIAGKRKGEKAVRFPSISRIITERANSFIKVVDSWLAQGLVRTFVISFLSAILLFALLQVSSRVERMQQEKLQAQIERAKIMSEITFWEGITSQYKGYRDAYFSLAVLEYRLGNKERARVYIKKVLQIDPNFEKGREMEKLLRQ